jgi:hypothetical protein
MAIVGASVLPATTLAPGDDARNAELRGELEALRERAGDALASLGIAFREAGYEVTTVPYG